MLLQYPQIHLVYNMKYLVVINLHTDYNLIYIYIDLYRSIYIHEYG